MRRAMKSVDRNRSWKSQLAPQKSSLQNQPEMVATYLTLLLSHSPLLLRLPRFFHFCQIYAGQLFVDQPIEVALQGATNKNFITLL